MSRICAWEYPSGIIAGGADGRYRCSSNLLLVDGVRAGTGGRYGRPMTISLLSGSNLDIWGATGIAYAGIGSSLDTGEKLLNRLEDWR